MELITIGKFEDYRKELIRLFPKAQSIYKDAQLVLIESTLDNYSHSLELHLDINGKKQRLLGVGFVIPPFLVATIRRISCCF